MYDCHIYNVRIKERRGNITHFKKNGITTLKKHVNVDHVVLAKRFEEMNFPLKNILEKKLVKKRPNFEISKKIGAKDPFKKDVQQK